MIKNNTKLVVTKGQISSPIDSETIILNINSGVYYSLNSVGQTIWNLLQQPKTFAEVCDTLLAKYDVEYERCENDLLFLLKKLQSEGLIQISNEEDIQIY